MTKGCARKGCTFKFEERAYSGSGARFRPSWQGLESMKVEKEEGVNRFSIFSYEGVLTH